jgi:hypothetical protein
MHAICEANACHLRGGWGYTHPICFPIHISIWYVDASHLHFVWLALLTPSSVRRQSVHSLSSAPNPASFPPASFSRFQSFLCLPDQSQPSPIALERARLHDQSPVASTASSFDIQQSSRSLSLHIRIWTAFTHARIASLASHYLQPLSIHQLGSDLVTAITSATPDADIRPPVCRPAKSTTDVWPFRVSPKVGAVIAIVCAACVAPLIPSPAHARFIGLAWRASFSMLSANI